MTSAQAQQEKVEMNAVKLGKLKSMGGTGIEPGETFSLRFWTGGLVSCVTV